MDARYDTFLSVNRRVGPREGRTFPSFAGKAKENTMKTLKSILAVATAVGLATAVQAVQDKDVSTGFEKLNVGTRVVTGIPDTQNADDTFPSGLNSYFKYTGANDDDNESAIVEFTEADVVATRGKRPKGVSKFTGLDATAHAKALQVSTGTDPLLRTFADYAASPNAITETKYVDTLVQFTVTPHDDTVTPSADDKLMIYLKETMTVDNSSTNLFTNLVVKAGIIAGDAENFHVETNEYTLSGANVEPGKWYRLTVTMIPNVFSDENWDAQCMGFLINIDGNECLTSGSFWKTEEVGNALMDNGVLADIVEELNQRLVIPIIGFGALPLQGVGFAGEGKVDDFVYTSTDPTATVVDFTFGFDVDKIDAVNYLVAGSEWAQSNKFEDVVVGSLVEITKLEFRSGYEFDKYTLAGVTQEATTTEGSVATFKINDDATGNVSLTIVAKEKAATYPTYVADADDTVKGNYDTWLADVSGIAAGGDASTYEKQFLLNQAISKAIADNALVIKSITENTNGGWDIVIGCSVEGVGLSTTEGENAQVCNGYLAVSYTSDLSGTWTTENINVTAGTENGTVKVNVNKSGAKFMKVSLKAAKEPTQE